MTLARLSMKTAQNEASCMYEIESIPGPCCLCYRVSLELKRIPGRCGDGVCESCDEVRFNIYRPRARFLPWKFQKIEQARKCEEQALLELRRRAAAPLDRARVPAPAMRHVS